MSNFPNSPNHGFNGLTFGVKRVAIMYLAARFGYGGRITQSVTAHCPPMIQTGRNELHNPAIEGWQNEIPIAI